MVASFIGGGKWECSMKIRPDISNQSSLDYINYSKLDRVHLAKQNELAIF